VHGLIWARLGTWPNFVELAQLLFLEKITWLTIFGRKTKPTKGVTSSVTWFDSALLAEKIAEPKMILKHL
jgi:hypothetical protein